MRPLLRRLPTRWQIAVLHTIILTLVLGGVGGVVLIQQRAFLIRTTATRIEIRAHDFINTGVTSPVTPSTASLASPPTMPPRTSMQDIAQGLASPDTGAAVLAVNGVPLARASLGPPVPVPDMGTVEAAVQRKADTRFTGSAGGEPMLAVLIPLQQQGNIIALAEVSAPMQPINEALDQLSTDFLVGWVLTITLATLLSVRATRHVLRPLERMAHATRQIAAGDLSQRVGLPADRTEIGQLSVAFDTMVTQLEAAFTAQRRFVADAAHELRTPLTALAASVELLQMGADEADPATTHRLLHHLNTEMTRLIRLTNDLLILSALDARTAVALQPTDLSVLLMEIGEYFRGLLVDQTLRLTIAPGLRVNGDADRLRQVILNLLDNARKYTPSGGQITLHAARDGQEVRVTVRDTGIGIPPDAVPHLFERFYRADSARTRQQGGSGLGLAIVQALIQAHGGQVEISSERTIGTTVRIHLPSLLPSGNHQDMTAASSRMTDTL